MRLLILTGLLTYLLVGCATPQPTGELTQPSEPSQLFAANEDFVDFEAELLPADANDILQGAKSHRVAVARTAFAYATPTGADPGMAGRTKILKQGDELMIPETKGTRVRAKLKSGHWGYVFSKDFEEIPDLDFDFSSDLFSDLAEIEDLPPAGDDQLAGQSALPAIEPDLPNP